MFSLSKRMEWIDMLRGLCILFVVIGHLRPNTLVERYLYSIHVFLFFAISGFLFSPDTKLNLNYIRNKARRLLTPYVFWSVFATIMAIILGTHWTKALRTMLTLGGSIGINRPIWFLPVLFVTEILYALLHQRWKSINLFLLLACPPIWYACKGFTPIFKLDIVPLALFFFSLGALLRHILLSENAGKPQRIMGPVVLAGAALCHLYFGVYKNIRIVFTFSEFGNYLFCILAGIGGVLFFFLVFHKLPTCHLLARIGRTSLFIMCIHYRLLFWGDLIVEKLFTYDLMGTRSTVKAVLVGVIVTLSITAFTYLSEPICIKYPAARKLAQLVGIPVSIHI